MKLLQSKNFLRTLVVLSGLAIWFSPAPDGLKTEAWQLFAIFFAAIFAIIVNVLPIFTASIIALSLSILTGLLTAAEAYSGFAKSFILLIVVAFLVARGVVKSGLGKRIALLIIRKFGSSSLGLGYSMVATDLIIAPAFPSNTARSGVLFPIVQSLANDSGSKVADGTRKKMGSFLMMNSMAGISISSALWFTAMAANPVGAGIAKEMGIDIDFASWFLAAVVPSLAAFAIIPYLIYKVFPPKLKKTPEAPRLADEELQRMGPVHRNEWITGITFILMVTLWALSGVLGMDKTAIALAGLAVLMVSNIFTINDIKDQGEALSVLIWFAALYTLSTYLNKFGFMGYIGEGIAGQIAGLSWPVVYALLIVIYVLIHYLFVSQTAHMLALYGVFLGVGLNAGVPGEMMALMLLFATNFNSVITPQGSSANVLFLSSGYITAGEVYKNGGIVTAANTVIYLVIGTLWMMVLGLA
ncbi:MAG: DASS family sodium-coupled anion symporter [Sulfurimonadaceae bacterium]|nr:DASS family sodium-coupled anion symporter [Sulfurimonadaceae bacterium]